MNASEIVAESVEPLDPDAEKVGDVFARLGYGFADAVADLVDNSVDAGASQVHIRFLRSSAGIHSVTVADNGRGMSSRELKEAMRFGSKSRKDENQLGKYGVGLKSASLSQADSVTVATHQAGNWGGRRWTLENVKQGWLCEVLPEGPVKKLMAKPVGRVSFEESGTVVIWAELEHLKALPTNIDKVLASTTKELQTELGIRFHRFIDSGQLEIAIDQHFVGSEPTGVHTLIAPLDPFSYRQSPIADYPVTFRLMVGPSAVDVECHIWPPKSKSHGYRLGGGKVALRQGFYFYRNDRVIQAGGWNRVRADDGEPHFSLARVRVELPAKLDSLFKLDVTKSRLDPAPEFLGALLAAKTADGKTFDRFLSDAESAYRHQKKKERAKFPFVPGAGVPERARRAIKTILNEPGTDPPTPVSFRWGKLDPDEVFRLKASKNQIVLNSSFRSHLKGGARGDAPLIKMLLLFLLQDEIGKAYVTSVSRERLQRINQSLIASLKA